MDVIRTTLRRCQEIILAKGYLPKQILNLDETAINFGVGPTHVFASSTASRGSQEVSDWKGRITGVPTVDAEGGFLPTMFILRHSKSSAKCSDQTRMRVIQNLHQRTGFTRQDGWEFKKWERELEMPDEKRIKQKKMHSVNYLIHTRTGNVITSQYKAWNDTVRMAMLIDLILKPESEKRGGKLFLWMDNCGVHKGDCLDAIYEEANVEVGYLPPNMTYILQVLDLVVNGPIKAHIRRLRAHRIVEYFKGYKDLYAAQQLLPQDNRVRPAWNPPKPTLEECMKDLFALVENEFADDEFRTGITKCFRSTGLCYREDKSFVEFSFESSGGTFPIAPTGTVAAYPRSADDTSHVAFVDSLLDDDDDE